MLTIVSKRRQRCVELQYNTNNVDINIIVPYVILLMFHL